MRRHLPAIGALSLATGAVGFLSTSLLPRSSSSSKLAGRRHHDLCRMCASSADDAQQEGVGASQALTREGWLKATTAAAALGVGIAVSPGSSTAADGGTPKGLPASGYFVQHAVFKVPDMDEEVKFFTEGLGMKVVRQREVNGARNVFVAYGDESLQTKDGGYFSLELVYDPKAPPGYSTGGPFQYLGLTLDSTLATIAYKVDAAVSFGWLVL
ncbi:unnamed protein product [Ectocarpus fasciculatus]